MGTRRAPFIAVRNHWDQRSEKKPWTAYSSEADKALAQRLAESGPGKGFHECLNFAFDHPDNRPELHLYLPPSCLPSWDTTDAADLLIFMFTYAEGGGPYPRHLVAIGGHATLAADKNDWWPTRKNCGELYGEKLCWAFSADRDAACVLVEPIAAHSLGIDYLDGDRWREGLRYVQPDDALAILEAVRDSGSAVHANAGERGGKKNAAHRQVQVCEELIRSYGEVLSGERLEGPKSLPGKRGAGGYSPDDEAGRRAEKAVYQKELKRVRKQLKRAKIKDDPEQHVIWWRDHGRDREHHDIESVRVSDGGELQRLLLEVKSSRVDDFSTVHVSEAQLQCARDATKDGVLHEFVFVETRSNGTVGQMHRLSLAEVEALLTPVQWRVMPGVWVDRE